MAIAIADQFRTVVEDLEIIVARESGNTMGACYAHLIFGAIVEGF